MWKNSGFTAPPKVLLNMTFSHIFFIGPPLFSLVKDRGLVNFEMSVSWKISNHVIKKVTGELSKAPKRICRRGGHDCHFSWRHLRGSVP